MVIDDQAAAEPARRKEMQSFIAKLAYEYTLADPFKVDVCHKKDLERVSTVLVSVCQCVWCVVCQCVSAVCLCQCVSVSVR